MNNDLWGVRPRHGPSVGTQGQFRGVLSLSAWADVATGRVEPAPALAADRSLDG
jgi:hypothetical protein